MPQWDRIRSEEGSLISSTCLFWWVKGIDFLFTVCTSAAKHNVEKLDSRAGLLKEKQPIWVKPRYQGVKGRSG